jgi:glutamine synthetase
LVNPAALGRDELPHGVEWLRVIWVNCAGVRRCRVVPRAAAAAARDGLGLASACLFLPCHANAPPDDPAASPDGEVRLCPDLSTARALPWRPTHAAALADLRAERAAGGGPWECCPCGALRRALALLAAECDGAALDVGFELEFTLLRPPPPGAPPGESPTPLDASLYCQTAALDAAAPVLDAACAYIAALGERVEQYHSESAPGQFEIVTAHAEALAAADAIVLRKEAVGAATAGAGLVASFLPKLDAAAAGSGLHCHFSLRGGATADAARPHGLSALGEAFAAGVLAHLPALLAFTAPSPNSERRRAPSTWAGAFACWGVQNREAPLRLCGDAAPAPGGGGASLN